MVNVCEFSQFFGPIFVKLQFGEPLYSAKKSVVAFGGAFGTQQMYEQMLDDILNDLKLSIHVDNGTLSISKRRILAYFNSSRRIRFVLY